MGCKRLLLFIVLPLVIIGCSAQKPPTISEFSSPKADSLRVKLQDDDGTLLTYEVVRDTAALDTSGAYDDGFISRLLENARHHYLLALQAQSTSDSALSAAEFEIAINILNELSYFPEIEKNTEYSELTRSVIEDYEKYITSIDKLSPESSVFALREKLNQIVETIDVSKMHFPKEVVTSTTISLAINYSVEQNIAFYQQKGREHFERWLNLSGKYFPIMKKIFREEGVPEEIVYLSMMESGLNPQARSWARAVGLWQFVQGTGRLYGLGGNFWYDERRDFEKSTRAAAKHFKDLYAHFGDWYLTLAAYNAGARKIERALRRSGTKDFWVMRRHLPRQTRNYVPQFIAVALMAMKPEDFGFNGIPRGDVLKYDVVKINGSVDLSVLARCAETDVEILRELNPELIQWLTPPNQKDYWLRIPAGKAKIFAKNYAKVPEDQKRNWIVYKVRKGDTLGKIAKKYGVTIDIMLQTNRLRSVRNLPLGKEVLIPIPADKKYYAASGLSERTSKNTKHGKNGRLIKSSPSITGKEKVSYHVKKGDTMSQIAGWYHVRLVDLRNWNDIPYGRMIRESQVLTVWVPKEKAVQYRELDKLTFEEKEAMRTGKSPELIARNEDKKSKLTRNDVQRYIVKRGDTLWRISRKFGVQVSDLEKWNSRARDGIHPGDELIIYR